MGWIVTSSPSGAAPEGPPELPLAWVTGAAGLLGHALVHAATAPELPWRVRPLTRQDLDLTDFRALRRLYHRDSPALIIHCAAISRTAACEVDPATARLVNVEVTRQLTELAGSARFVFFSTDLVFDGRRGQYREDDPVHPLSVYAETKVAAEERVQQHPRHLIVRTSLNLGRSPRGDRAFNEELRRAWASGRVTRLFTDEFRSPIAATETARLVWALIQHQATGTFHVAGGERLSRWELGRLLARHWPDLKPLMVPASQKDQPGPPRPPDTSLNCAKAETLLGQPMPAFSSWLANQPPGTL